MNVSVQSSGADRVIHGKLKKNGKEVKISKPLDAMKQGIAYLPEDRKIDGIVGDLSVRDNIILAAQVLAASSVHSLRLRRTNLQKNISNFLKLRRHLRIHRSKHCPVVTSRKLFLPAGF